MKKVLMVFLSLFFVTSLVQAQPIDTDRPTFTDSVTTVEKGQIQLEGGYTRYTGGGVRVDTFGESLLRYGLNDNVEVRAYGNSYQVTRTAVGNFTGLQDSGVGTKIRLVKGETKVLRPNVSVELNMSLPTGARNFRSNYQPQGKVLLGWNLGKDTKLESALELTRADLGRRVNQTAQSAAITHQVNDRVGAFVEVYNINPGGMGSTSTTQTGVMYRVSNDLQLDLRVGRDISGGSREFFGMGAGYRF